jgi:hypothetical protein
MHKVNAQGKWGARAIGVAGLMAVILVGVSPPAWASVQLNPTSGPGGTHVTVEATAGGCSISIVFRDANGTSTWLGSALSDPYGGDYHVTVLIPTSAAEGVGTITVTYWIPSRPPLHGCRTPAPGPSAPFTVTAFPSGTQLLGNPGFENGSSNPAPWATSARINATSAEPAHSGSWDTWLGGTGTTHRDRLYQVVAIPAAINSVTLAFCLHIDTADTGSTAHDVIQLEVRNTSKALLARLSSYSNLDAGPGYEQKTFDLTAFAGQNIVVYLSSIRGRIPADVVRGGRLRIDDGVKDHI